jgi:hypothetical protein
LTTRLTSTPSVDGQVERLGEVGGDAAAGDAEVGVLDLTGPFQLADHFARGVDRHGEADADVAVAAAGLRSGS